MPIEAYTHLNLILPRKTSAGFICISFSVRAIVRSVMPIGVTQFNLCRSHVKREGDTQEDGAVTAGTMYIAGLNPVWHSWDGQRYPG